MKRTGLLLMGIAIVLIGCGENKTTHTRSDHFTSLKAKQDFLEHYVAFKRHYQSVEYKIDFADGESGLAPGPSEWDIKIFAKVPSEEIHLWTDGLKPCEIPDLKWAAEIPHGPGNFQGFTWYQDEAGKIVGVNPSTSEVLYRISAQ